MELWAQPYDLLCPVRYSQTVASRGLKGVRRLELALSCMFSLTCMPVLVCWRTPVMGNRACHLFTLGKAKNKPSPSLCRAQRRAEGPLAELSTNPQVADS